MFFAGCGAGARAQEPLQQQPQDSVQITVDSLQTFRKDSRSIVQQDSSAVAGDTLFRAPVAGDTLSPVSVAGDTLSPAPLAGDAVRNKVDSVISATSSDALFAPDYLFKPSPRKAVIYAAIFPGLGQVYNRKYWKLPILYGGFVGFVYAITWNNGYYRDYLGAYQDILDDDPNTNRWHNMLPYGQDPGTTDIQWFTDVLQQRKDYYRYYRDFSIIGTVALYLVAIADAYVDAQLFDFDISPDLSMRVEPAILREGWPTVKGNSAYGVQWSFNF
jgi:hypothetical protein